MMIITCIEGIINTLSILVSLEARDVEEVQRLTLTVKEKITNKKHKNVITLIHIHAISIS